MIALGINEVKDEWSLFHSCDRNIQCYRGNRDMIRALLSKYCST